MKTKVRGCAIGRQQRESITKEESSSPTVSLYALMGSGVIDAMDELKATEYNRSIISIRDDDTVL